MILLDTDILTLLFQGHARIANQMKATEDEVATTLVTWIEVLQGRFEAILKAANANQLRQAQERLRQSQQQLATLPIIPVSASAGAEFELVRRNKELKKIGRGDLLIASIALSLKATLVTRNLRDFRQVPTLKTENWAG
jgi:tRNA(fMet)-specific endonuclease VapC